VPRGGGGTGAMLSTTSTSTATTTNAPLLETLPINKPVEIFRNDYRPLPYTVATVHMNLDIRNGKTIVTTELVFVANPIVAASFSEECLQLDGDETCVTLKEVCLNGRVLTEGVEYRIAPGKLLFSLPPPLDECVVRTTCELVPEQNSQLSGLYKDGPMYCTQCEAEGFRRITYYPDRPDNMAVFETVRIEADKDDYPVLLSNGNLVEQGDVDEGGRHYAVWNDPFPKPR
jgi:aminopeptidase N